MKIEFIRIIAVLLTVCVAFACIPSFAYAGTANTVAAQSSENTNSIFDTMIKRIKAFFNAVEAFFAGIFGNKPLDLPEVAPDTISAPDDGSKMNLVWYDEFDSSTLDSNKWNLCAKMKQSDVINGTDERNVKVEDGMLVMRSWKEEDGKYSTNTSVTTDGIMSFQYGYLEIYANVPYVEGGWPSFWMQSKDIHRSADYMTEIDMFEIYNTKNTVRTDIHKWYSDGEHCNIGGNQIYYKFKRSINLNNEYHLYGFGWTPEEMYFTVDGKIFGRYDLSQDFGDKGDGMQGFHDPVYIIFNNYIFTDNSSWKNPPVNDDTEWPITYNIDWIRLYQKEGEGRVFNDTGF